jgi:predicted MFS family arabinose efflux permease
MKLILAVFFTFIAGGLTTGAAPLLVGAFVDDLGFTASAAGSLVTFEMLALCVATMLMANRISRTSRRKWAYSGAAITIVGQLVSTYFTDFQGLAVVRIATGLGEGICFASASAAAASAAEPDRLFAEVLLLEMLIWGILLAALPFVILPYGCSGLFVTLAVLTVITVPCMAWLPDPDMMQNDQHKDKTPHMKTGVVLMISVAVISLTGNAVWSLSERIGLKTGLDLKAVGIILAVASFAGILGSGGAALLGIRWGRRLPLFFSIGASTFAMVMIAAVYEPVSYTCNQLLWGVAFAFMTPYMYGIAAVLDPLGRWTATVSGVMMGASALGPVVGGTLIGYRLAIIAGLSGIVTFALLLPVLKYMDERISDNTGIVD